MKKVLSVLAIVALLACLLSMSAFAHGGHGRRGTHAKQTKPSYTACTVDGCEQLGLHEHGGIYYYCAYYGTAHVCPRSCKR